MVDYTTLGILLGLSAGFAPGPLLALVISETLRHDVKSGVKVALSPVFTDLPIILVTLLVLSQLAAYESVLGIVSLVGGCVILFMGYESMRPKNIKLDYMDAKPQSLFKGILANALSPHPYLFWMSVGGPIMTKAMGQSVPALLAFIGGFYVALIGSKILLAILVGKSKSFLQGRVYIYIMRVLGCALCVLAVFLLKDGLTMLGFIAH